MKTLAIWMAVTLVAFGVLGGVTHVHLSRHPRRILVAVDTSYAMTPDWSGVARVVHGLTRERYASFALVTDKGQIHGWAPWPDPPASLPLYAPRDFSRLTGPNRFPEIERADRLILVTNAPPTETKDLGGWEILRPAP